MIQAIHYTHYSKNSDANHGYYYLNCMEDSDVRIKQQLVTAGQLFAAGKYGQCRKILGEIKMAHPSIELNQLIAECKDSPGKIPTIAKKIIDSLPQLNSNNGIKSPAAPSQLHYWNAVVLSQLIGQAEVTQLVSEEGLRQAKGFRTETILMLAYSLLSAREKAGRVASCLSVINLAEKLAGRNNSLGELEKAYRFMIQVALTRVLLKLNFSEAAKVTFMMRFNQTPESKEETELSQISGISVAIHQQLLHAEIEYHSGSYPQATRILSELLPQLDGRNKEFLKAIIDHNMEIILTQYSKAAASQVLMRKSLKYIASAEELENHNQRQSMIQKCKQNLILAGLLAKDPMLGNMYESIKDCGSYGSFKQSYRKAEVCIKYYQQLLTEQPRVLLNKEVHDSYEPVYFYPNQPYFQQKGKNKNPNFTNGRAYYRRYVMPEWEGQPSTNLMRENEGQRGAQVKQEKKKEKQKSTGRNGKGKKEEEPQKQSQIQAPVPQKSKIMEVLASAESYLQQALAFLEKQISVLLIMDNQHKDLTDQANIRLHVEYTNYKSNIYSLLTFVKLGQRQWTQALQCADNYLDFARHHQLDNLTPTHQQTYYSVLAYRIEALCELGRMPSAYEAMQEAARLMEYSINQNIMTISTGSQQAGQSYCEDMNELTNFYYNLAVLHCRDNKIPQAFQAIQKLMHQLRVVPSSPQARMSLSTLELLIHYNLRTGNTSSALQLIKRRRILALTGGIAHHPPTLSITK